MRSLALVVVVAMFGCDSKKPAARVQLADLTTASTLAPVRAAFNATKGEARFLTLLSPT